MTDLTPEQSVRRAVAALVTGDFDGFSALLTDDVTFDVTWSAFRTFHGRERVMRLMTGTFAQLDPFTMTIDELIVDGDTVVELAHGVGEVSGTGEPYENTYCRVWRFRDGKIAAVREFMDTERARVLTTR